MLSNPERRVLAVFRQYLVSPGQMLCFNGPQLASCKPALRHLSDKGFVVKEEFKGGYSLTCAGFAAMKKCKS
jgi:hypothetical protein